jgi:leader peptidase (prepilin peptidase)/N-methyltransferase
MCESCGHTLGVIDLVPLFSWLSTGGKCRYCHKPIGIQAIALELLTSASFILLYLQLPTTGDQNYDYFVLGSWLIYSVGLIGMAVYDLRHLIIPNRIILPLIVLAGIHVLVHAIVFDGGAEVIRDAVLGLFAGGGLFYVLFMVSGGRWIGGGDVKLGFFMGLALGPISALIALWLAFLVALMIILPLMLLKVVGRKDPIPFGPFLIISTYIAAIWGQRLADWYADEFLKGII